jgi:hypothetical protein
MHGEDQKCIQNFDSKQDCIEDMGVDGKIILKWILNRA